MAMIPAYLQKCLLHYLNIMKIYVGPTQYGMKLFNFSLNQLVLEINVEIKK